MTVDRDLVQALAAVVGRDHVLTDPEQLYVYSFDGTIERAMPRCVVLPGDARETAEAVRVCRRFGVPVTPRGAGTGLSGGAVPAGSAVVVSTARMNRILAIDPVDRVAVVQPGVTNLAVSEAAAPYGLFYAPDPSSQRACTVGGNIAENAGGPHCLALGVTTNHVLGVEVVTAAGDTVWLGGRCDEAPGFDLRGAFIGSEGTLGIVTAAVLRLLPRPPSVVTILAAFPDVASASEAVAAIIGAGVVPAALEMMDRNAIRAVEAALACGYPPDAGAVLLAEVEGSEATTDDLAARIEERCRAYGALELRRAADPRERELLWRGRKGAIGALGNLAPNYYILDGVVPRSKLPEAMRRVEEVAAAHGLTVANVFHAGDGNLHPCLVFDEREPGTHERVLQAGAEIIKACIELGGALTGEHGVGLEKREFFRWVFSDIDIENMARLRAVFGNDGSFNPCKALPTGTGCGEMAHRPFALARAGSDAYI
jgi:glycolate oxidase